MLHITQVKSGSVFIETGVIQENLGNQKYNVKMGEKTIELNSIVSGLLQNGDRVIINRTDHGMVIVGKFKNKGKQQMKKEIIVNG